MKSIPYIVTDESITVVVRGKPFTISNSNAAYNEVYNRIQNEDFDGIEKLFDTGAAVGSFTNGNIVVQNNQVLYKGQPVHNHVVDRILAFMRDGLPYKPLVAFLDNLLANPSFRAVQELYGFLEATKLPITEDGCFLAFRKVTSDYKDFYTRKIDNSLGAVVTMPRNLVNEDKDQTCSHGLHFCSYSYLPQYHGGEGRVVIVKINPSDVVAIPSDYNNAKGRCCKYEVISDCAGHDAGQQFGAYYGDVKQDEPEVEVESPELCDESGEDMIEESYQEGYAAGNTAAAHGIARDAESAYNFGGGSLDEEIFVDGYHSGYDDYVAPSLKKSSGISESTRQKLRDAANRQRRDSNGRYI